MAEYAHLGQGRTEPSDITLGDRMALLGGDIMSANRDNLSVGLNAPIADLVDLSLYGITALNDPSVVLNPWLIVSLYPGVGLWLAAYAPVGLEDSQVGRAGPGGFCRVKFSF
jgi:hypothetical protein